MNDNSILIYKTEDGKIKIETHFENETVWLNRQEIAKLFDRDVKTIGKHINNIFSDGELDKQVVVAHFAITTKHGAIAGKTQERQAEIQALNRTPMYMKDWIEQLDAFLKMTNKEILQHSGTVSHKAAIEKAHKEYELYREKTKDQISQVEKDFIKQIESTNKKLEARRQGKKNE